MWDLRFKILGSGMNTHAHGCAPVFVHPWLFAVSGFMGTVYLAARPFARRRHADRRMKHRHDREMLEGEKLRRAQHRKAWTVTVRANLSGAGPKTGHARAARRRAGVIPPTVRAILRTAGANL